MDLADLGYAIDDVGNFGAEEFFDFLEGCKGIFDNVMKKTDADGHRIHLHFGQQIRHFKRMGEVSLARGTHLSLVFLRRKNVCAANQVETVTGMVFLNSCENLFQANHGSRVPEKRRSQKPGARSQNRKVPFWLLAPWLLASKCYKELLVAQRNSARTRCLLGILLTGFKRFIEPLVGLGDELSFLSLIGRKPGFLAVQEVLVRHRILVSRIECESLVEIAESFFNKLSLFLRRRRVVLIENHDPVHAAYRIERQWICWIQTGVFQVELARSLKLVGVLVNAGQPPDRSGVIRISL